MGNCRKKRETSAFVDAPHSLQVLSKHCHRPYDFLGYHLVTFAIIDTPSSSRSIPSRSTSRPQSGTTSSAHSTPRPTSRRSEVNSQLYQFALGYPLTPPDTSPVKELSESSLQIEASGLRGSMGTFVFKWCVERAWAMAQIADQLRPRQWIKPR